MSLGVNTLHGSTQVVLIAKTDYAVSKALYCLHFDYLFCENEITSPKLV